MTFPGKTGHASLASLLVMTFKSTSNELAIVSRTQSSAMSTSKSTVSAVEEQMMDANALGRVTEVALSFTDLNNDEERKHVFRSMALLANLTRSERGAAGFLLGGAKQLKKLENDEDDGKGEGPNESNEVSPSVQLLLGRFLSDKYIRVETKTESMYDILNEVDVNADDDNDDVVNDEEKVSPQDPYLHFASVLTNITQINAGRNFITSMHIHHTHNNMEEKDQGETNPSSSSSNKKSILPPTLRTLLLLLRTSPSKLRCRGIAATIKNCCFDTDISKLWILPLSNMPNIDTNDDNDEANKKKKFIIPKDEDMITSLLYPLVGPEEISEERDLLLLDPLLYSLGPDKLREPDAKTRLHIVETLLLLCASGRKSREILRSKGAYVVLKYADLVEEEEHIGEKINECVQYLKRDEEGMDDGGSDSLALQMAKERRKLQEDYDGVD